MTNQNFCNGCKKKNVIDIDTKKDYNLALKYK